MPSECVVSSLVWQMPFELHELQAEEIEKLGYTHRFQPYDDVIPADCKIVVIQGPYGTLLPFVQQLEDLPESRRPVVVYWFQQSMSLIEPPWLQISLAQTFSDLYRYAGDGGWLSQVTGRLLAKIGNAKGRRLGFLGDILWLDRHALLDLLVLSSTVYSDRLRQFGVPSIIVPRGYHPSFGCRRNIERGIAVVWMGKTRTRRRKRIIYGLRDELKGRGLHMAIYDGEENGFIYGQERTVVLNRACFVLNVNCSGPTDELSIRYFVAAANGAVVLTEPGLNRYPFIPNEHLVECRAEQMADTIEYYVNNRCILEAISKSMFELASKELTLQSSIAEIMARAEDILESRRHRVSPSS